MPALCTYCGTKELESGHREPQLWKVGGILFPLMPKRLQTMSSALLPGPDCREPYRGLSPIRWLHEGLGPSDGRAGSPRSASICAGL